MNTQEVLIKVAQYLCGNQKVVTVNKVASETSLSFDHVSEALETLSGKGLATKRSIEDFDESCYQANENTLSFCEKLAKRARPQESSESHEKPTIEKSAETVVTDSSTDPVENFLLNNKADKKLVDHYKKIQAERSYFRKRSLVWERHIMKMVDGVTKELSS